MKRITRDRRLTAKEVEDDRKVRNGVEQEKPRINARIRQRLGELRQGKETSATRRTLGQRIRTAREARGLSQLSLAAAAEISQPYLSQLEQDQREPTLSIAARIARALSVPLAELAEPLA